MAGNVFSEIIHMGVIDKYRVIAYNIINQKGVVISIVINITTVDPVW